MDYLGQNITLNSYLKMQLKFETSLNVDESVRKYRKEIYDFLLKEGISSRILDVLFIKDLSLQKAISDEEYLEVMKQGLREESIRDIARMFLDFYVIEHALRRKYIVKVDGSSLNQFIKSPTDSVEQLLLKSEYYKWIGHIDLVNYRKHFDEYLYRSLKDMQYVNIGLDGIVSRVVRNLLEIENQAIIEKAKRMHLDGSGIVRSYDE